MSLVGLGSVMHRAWNFVNDPMAKSVAILGEGGIGKTTLMRQLYNKVISTGDYGTVIWITVSSNFALEKVQDDIANSVGLFDAEWVELSFGQKADLLLHELLSRNNFVLFLDDIWERDVHFERLGVPHGEMYPHIGSKVVFTTRSEAVAENMYAVRVLRLNKLSSEDAWLLFWNNVGGTDSIAVDQQSFVYMVAEILVTKCDGLPLLLNTVGRAMAGRKTREEWFNALHEIHLMADMDSELAVTQQITLKSCPSLHELTWVTLAPNLAVLRVHGCGEIEEIVSGGRMGEILKDEDDMVPFEKLELLSLESLSNLKSIYWKSLPFQCLKKIKIIDCLLLNKLPLNSNSTKNDELVIEGEEEWWKDVEWEDNLAKITFLPCFKPILI